jgi:hypothetical protein
MGDFNHPEVDWINETCNTANTHPASKFLECTRDCFLTQHVKEPTHFRGSQTANTLDLILSSREDMVDNVQVWNPIGKSHHGMVSCNLNVEAKGNSTSRTSYKYDKGNYTRMAEDLELTNWEKQFDNKDTQECWDIFQNRLQELCNKWIPQRKAATGNMKTKPL